MSAGSGRPLRVAFVVQRYGEDVNGGAEQLCRALVRRLAARSEIAELAVLTTCARDHLTWANHYPAGESHVDGVRLERFPVAFRRWPRVQKRVFDAAIGPLPWRALEWLWLLAQGPYAPALIARIREVRERYDAFVFVTYLYHPTVRGLPLVRERAVLLSTAHDEPAIGLKAFRELFADPRAIACLTPEEADFLRGRFAPGLPRLEVVGSGIDAPPPAAELDDARPAAATGPYLLYVGRIEGEKGVPELLAGFRAFRERHGADTFTDDHGQAFLGAELKLLLAGRTAMPLPSDAAIVPLGFVSDAAKHALLRGCTALVAPSRYESLSLALLEAWQHARPVLVNAACAVTRGQASRASGGAAYAGADGLADAIARALGDRAWRAACGAAGRAYVTAEYGWDTVEARWLKLLAGAAA